eukprot:GEMP01006988.1.p1 GENE.GEMP01006988.1~~GEMP01006988.1.p1  ORF type:complete len:787 (+),score=229.90 GEMP01006988.1:40-2400(+)
MAAFANAGTTEGIEVWRLEKMTPEPWAQLGEFYSGDCYLVLHTIRARSRYDLYFWLGNDSTVDERGGIAYLAVELDQSLGDVPVQYREVQEHESAGFVALWKNHGGLRYLEGGVDSAFRHVVPEEYKPRLLHIKGKRSVRVREVVCSAASLNDGDAFILDAGLTLYAWNGKHVNRYEKVKAAEMMRYICTERSKSKVDVVKMVEDEATAEQWAAFWDYLGGELPIKDGSDNADELHDINEAHELILFTLQDDKWVPSGASAPFIRKDFGSQHIHLLDTNSVAGIFVWIGDETSVDARKKSMELAEEYLRNNDRPFSTPICRLHEGAETALFKSMVSQFETPRPKCWTQTVASMRPAEVDISALHQERAQATTIAARDRSEETICVWRIQNFDLVEIPAEQHGEFYDGDSYVVEYVYEPKKAGPKREQVLYFWQGQHSTVDEKGASAMFVTRLDNERHQGRATQVRVPMGKEPPAFLLLFNGKMIIHKGDTLSGFRRHTAPSPSPDDTDSTVRLYRIRGENPMECKAVQVFPVAASLHSNDVFVLIRDNDTATLWKGHGASAEEEEFGVELCERLCHASVVHKVHEGEEEEDFWLALGGKAEHANELAMCDPHFQPRLFQISNATGALRCEEVLNFTQDDLLEDDVMLLDVKTAVFIWIGRFAHREEIAQAPHITRQYIAAAPDNRGDVPELILHQGNEPLLFTCYFIWRESPARAKRLSSCIEKPGPDTYPLEQLQKELPSGVPSNEKERFLSDEDFQRAFNMPRGDFIALSSWKQTEQKKKALLF